MLVLWLSATMNSVKNVSKNMQKKGGGETYTFYLRHGTRFCKLWIQIFICTRYDHTKSKFSIQFPWWQHFSPHLNISYLDTGCYEEPNVLGAYQTPSSGWTGVRGCEENLGQETHEGKGELTALFSVLQRRNRLVGSSSTSTMIGHVND